MKTVFNYNTPVTAEWFNVVNGFRLRFDGDPLLPGDMVDGQYLPIRLQDLDPAILQPYVQSLDVVKTTGDQNINGQKTFLDSIAIPNGVNANQAINKAQLDDLNTSVQASLTALNTAIASANTARAALDAATVKLIGDQTIYDTKTFNKSPQVPPGSTPGAAVNYAQLMGLDTDGNQYGVNSVILPNGLKLNWGVFGTGAGGIGVNWDTGGRVTGYTAFNIQYISNPIVLLSARNNGQIVINILDETISGFTWAGDSVRSQEPRYGGALNWMAIGY
jgi:hypothetical protein